MLILTIAFAILVSQTTLAQDKAVETKAGKTEMKAEVKAEKKVKKEKKEVKKEKTEEVKY